MRACFGETGVLTKQRLHCMSSASTQDLRVCCSGQLCWQRLRGVRPPWCTPCGQSASQSTGCRGLRQRQSSETQQASSGEGAAQMALAASLGSSVHKRGHALVLLTQ